MNNLLALLNGMGDSKGDGAVVAIVSIVLVFLILGIIIAITYGVSIAINKVAKEEKQNKTETTPKSSVKESVELTDEDAKVAVLVASIDYRNETKKNIKVLSVKEIK